MRRRASSRAPNYELSRAAGGRLDRLAALARVVPLGLRARRPRHLAVLDERRHRRLHGVRLGLPAAAGLRGRTAVPRARLQGRVLGRAGRAADRRGRRAGGHRADALDAAVPVGRQPTASACTTATSRCTRGSGATATGSGSRPAAARSSTGARTRRSTARACAWARARSTAPRVGSSRSSTRWSSTSAGQDSELGGELRMILFVVLREGAELDEQLEREIKTAIREDCSPRHVPERGAPDRRGAAHALGEGARGAGQADPDGDAARAGRQRRVAGEPAGAGLLRGDGARSPQTARAAG